MLKISNEEKSLKPTKQNFSISSEISVNYAVSEKDVKEEKVKVESKNENTSKSTNLLDQLTTSNAISEFFESVSKKTNKSTKELALETTSVEFNWNK